MRFKETNLLFDNDIPHDIAMDSMLAVEFDTRTATKIAPCVGEAMVGAAAPVNEISKVMLMWSAVGDGVMSVTNGSALGLRDKENASVKHSDAGTIGHKHVRRFAFGAQDEAATGPA